MARLLCVLLVFLALGDKVQASIAETNKPYTYETFEQDLEQIRERYGVNLETKIIGTTYFGRNIWGIKLGKAKKNIVLIGAHHGREWLTSMLLMKMLDNYAASYVQDRKTTALLDEVSIWFIPMLNPDGVAIQQHQLKGFPPIHLQQLVMMNDGETNFERWKANGIGIDLNRQYPAGWNELKDGSETPSYKLFKGKEPFQAKEVIALKNLIEEINPSIAVAYHTAGREIYWSYQNGTFRKRDHSLARKIASLTRYKLAKPPKDAIGGGFTDWFISSYHRPALTIEICPLVGETSPPPSMLRNEWKRNKLVGLKLAQEAKKITH